MPRPGQRMGSSGRTRRGLQTHFCGSAAAARSAHRENASERSALCGRPELAFPSATPRPVSFYRPPARHHAAAAYLSPCPLPGALGKVSRLDGRRGTDGTARALRTSRLPVPAAPARPRVPPRPPAAAVTKIGSSRRRAAGGASPGPTASGRSAQAPPARPGGLRGCPVRSRGSPRGRRCCGPAARSGGLMPDVRGTKGEGRPCSLWGEP